MKARRYINWLAVLSMLATAVLGIQGNRAHADQYFPQTGATIWGPFELYWNAYGGLSQFGLPRTTVFPTGKGYDAQWFERALFTYNPKNPDPNKVELQLLGAMATANRREEAPFQPARASGQGVFFAATNHNLSGKLLDYWKASGGLAIYGYPISEPFQEKNTSDGKLYTVQYFERNRLELHPELPGTRYEVQLGLLGSETLDTQGGPQAFANLGPATYYPPPTKAAIPPGGIIEGGQETPPAVSREVPPAPALPDTSAPVAFHDDFSTSDLTQWRAIVPGGAQETKPAGWRTEKGILEQWSDFRDEDTSDEAILVSNAADFDNFTMDAYVYATSGEPIGAVVRYSNSGFYLVKLYPQVANNTPKAQLFKVTSAGATLMANSISWEGYKFAAWQRLSVIAQGPSLTVQIDGQALIQAEDSGLTKGGFGLYAYADGTARFDNVRLTTR